MKKYPAYKPSGVDWIGDIPEHWEVKKLKYLASINPTKGSGDFEKGSNEMAVFLPMDKVSEDGGIDCSIKKPISELANGFTYFERNDTIVAKITPCFENGKGAFLDNLETQIGFGSTEFHVIRPYESVHPKLPCYITRSDFFKKIGEAFMVGSAGQKRIPTSFVEEFPVALPNDLPEQHSITSYLDRQTALIDDLVQKTTQKIALLREQRRALINRAVTRGLDPSAPMKDSGVEWIGEVPRHWEVVQLKRIIDPERQITYGIVQPGEEDSNGNYMVRGQDYSRGWANPDSIFKVSDEIEKPYARARLKPGDLLMTIVGAGTGNIEIVPDWLDGANITQTTARMAINPRKASSRFIYYCLSSFLKNVQLDLYVKGAAQPGLNLGHLQLFFIMLPPIAEQTEISGILDKQTSVIGTLILKEQQMIDLLKEYRQALISEVVTGKIDVRDS